MNFIYSMPACCRAVIIDAGRSLCRTKCWNRIIAVLVMFDVRSITCPLAPAAFGIASISGIKLI
jgi:hypothetical protein